MTMTLIESKVLASTQASIEFSSIPQDGTDLVLLMSARNVNNTAVRVSFNGVITNQSSKLLYGTGSSAAGGNEPSILYTYAGASLSSDTTNTFGNAQVYIPNYAITTIQKSVSLDGVSENNATSANQSISAGFWASTAAISSIQLTPATGNIEVGSTFWLYKITKGSSGGVVVS